MTAYATRLLQRADIARGTMAFDFARPPGFEFKAGQTIDLTLAGVAGAPEGADRHTFSIVSAPHEQVLTIATRMRASPFKDRLGALPVGAGAGVEGPFGSLTLHSNPARAAFLVAGGIGITPFVSMLRQARHAGTARPLVLVTSNRRPEDAPFLPELLRLERDGWLRLLATVTSASGRIDRRLLADAVRGLASPIAYVAGSPAFVADMRRELNGAGIGDDDIRSEDFLGY